MRLQIRLAAVPLMLWSGSALAQDDVAVTACDTLIAARRSDAATQSPEAPPPEAGCRRIRRAELGAVEQRAMIGGAPYECMTVPAAGHCLWIVP